MKDAIIQINITPRQFGAIAAYAIAQGYDVTAFLVKNALLRGTTESASISDTGRSAAPFPQEFNQPAAKVQP